MAFEKIKYSLGGKFLSSKTKSLKRKIQLLNFSEVKSICILADFTKDNDFKTAKDFISEMEKAGKKVSGIGYVPSRELSTYTNRYTGFHFISEKDINWVSRPTASFIDDSLNREYDLLIDMCIETPVPLQYVLAFSKARCKAGRLTQLHDFYDVMIDTTSNRDDDYFLQQLQHYLSVINKK